MNSKQCARAKRVVASLCVVWVLALNAWLAIGAQTFPAAWNFEDQSLNGWYDRFQQTPPTNNETVISSEGTNHFVHFLGTCSAIACLPTPITVDTNLNTIEVTLRCANTNNYLMGAAFTTCTYPPGYWYGNSSDRGFCFQGYQYDNSANAVGYYDGTMHWHCGSAKLFPSCARWQTARMVFNRPAGTVSVYSNGSATPALTQTNVNLDGAVLRGLWLSANYADYDDISVSYSFVLVDNGQPASTIVLATNHTVAAHLAAQELQHYLEKITAAQLPIVYIPDNPTPGELIGGAKILVGPSYYTEQLGLSATNMCRQEYLIETHGTDLVLLGCDEPVYGDYNYTNSAWWPETSGLYRMHEMGSLYAVYTFLEKFAGVRWYWPTEEGEVAPPQSTFAVASVSLLAQPAWRSCDFNQQIYTSANLWVNPFRPETMTISANIPAKDTGLYRLRNKDGRDIFAASHSWLLRSYLWRTNSQGIAFTNANPEWWGANPKLSGYQMCLSSPGFKAQVVQDIANIFSGQDPVAPGLSGVNLMLWQAEVNAFQISLGPEDSQQWCACSNCEALYDSYDPALYDAGGGYWEGSRSRYVWTFVRDVATNVAVLNPDVTIGCLAYSQYYYPPSIALPDNVQVMKGVLWNTYNNPSYKTYDRQVTETWHSLVADRLGGYGYFLYPREMYPLYYYSCSKPLLMQWPTWNLSFSAPRMLADGIRHDASNGMHAFCAELSGWPSSSGRWDNPIWDHLNLYITWKLSEDPSLDVDALLGEYYDVFYGPAKAPMSNFWETVETIYVSSNHDDYAWVNSQVLSLGSNIAGARAAAPDTNSVYRKRIERVNEGVFNMLDDSRKLHIWPLTLDFEDQSLDRWTDRFQQTPPTNSETVISSEGTNHFVHFLGTCSAIACLPTPITVDTNLNTIEVTLRCANTNNYLMGAALTTCTYPPGYWYGNSSDRGFCFQGYQYDNYANAVGYYDGTMHWYCGSAKLFPSCARWQTARLVFDRPAGTVSVYSNGSATPALTQTNVNLDGAVLRGVWLSGNYADYDDIVVSYTAAP